MLKFRKNGSGYIAESVFGNYEIDKHTYPTKRYEVLRDGGHLELTATTLEEAKQKANVDYHNLLEFACKELGIVPKDAQFMK